MGERLSIEEMHRTAKRFNIICLSTEYISSSTHILWKCKTCNNEWLANPNNIRRGGGCPVCADESRRKKRIKYTIKDMQILAHLRGGKCLSKKYINYTTKLEWECKEGHRWFEKLSDIKSGYWCPFCAGKRHTIEEMHELAKAKGGKCLSEEYKGMESKLHWECKNGHDWFVAPHNLYHLGRWCPYCTERKNEHMVRIIFKNLFEVDFHKVKPKWLTYKKKRLELDGYNKELKLAFEYNGKQHYELTYFNNYDPENLEDRKRKDRFKKMKCKKLGITLITIPYKSKTNLEKFILKRLHKNNIKIP